MVKSLKIYVLHFSLFSLTVLTTLMVGTELITPKILVESGQAISRMWFGEWYGLPPALSLSWSDLRSGIPYSVSFLAFLTFHEFGHYFTSVYHRVKCSLPYYIPMYLPLGVLNIGSLGAVIRLRQIPESTRKFFDIGVAGPIAGFVVSCYLLIHGFSHLPPLEPYLTHINPDYEYLFGGVPSEAEITTYIEEEGGAAYYVGTSLLFELLKQWVPEDPAQVPNHFELIHYPHLFVGYITLFFTALNLLPIGQLDGGHVIYGMFGRKISGIIGRVAVLALIFIGGTGIADLNFSQYVGDTESLLSYIGGQCIYALFIWYVLARAFPYTVWHKIISGTLLILLTQGVVKYIFPEIQANFIWLLYTFLVVRGIGIDHPPARFEQRVNFPRQLLGWLAILIFILCFSPNPVKIVGG